MIPGSAGDGIKLSIGGCYAPYVNAEQAERQGMTSGCSLASPRVWLCHLPWSLKMPEVVLMPQRYFQISSITMMLYLCEKQLVVGSKSVLLEKWQIVWEPCGEGWFDDTDLLRLAVGGITCRGWSASGIASQSVGRKLASIYLCAVEMGPLFAPWSLCLRLHWAQDIICISFPKVNYQPVFGINDGVWTLPESVTLTK